MKPAALVALIALAGCDNVSRPNRPLPELKATGLDGTEWARESFDGRPWVVNVWMPG